MRAVFTTIIFSGLACSCLHGDFSDRLPRNDASPGIVASEFEAEFQEPSQPASGRRDHRMLFIEADGYASPRRRVVMWGGFRNNASGPSFLANGATFNPRTKRWRGLDGEMIPQQRIGHSLVWTGDKLIVWGGDAGATKLATGSCLDPVAMKWKPIAASISQRPRADHGTVWSNGKMVVMGGCRDCPFSESYDPGNDTWQKIQDPSGEPPKPTGLALPVMENGTSSIMYIEKSDTGSATGRTFLLSNNTEPWRALRLNELENLMDLRVAAEVNSVFIVGNQNNTWRMFQWHQDNLRLESVDLPKEVASWKVVQHVVTIDGHLVLLGGEPGTKVRLAFVRISDIKSTGAWAFVESGEAPLMYSGSAATALEKGQLLIWGGESASLEKYDAKGYVFDIFTRAWTIVSDQP